MGRELWVAPTGAHAKVAGAALESGAGVLVSAGDRALVEGVGRPRVGERDGAEASLDGATARFVPIHTPADQEGARALIGKVDVLVAAPEDWTVIPLENLVAWTHGSPTRLFARVRSASDAQLALTTLETGVAGLVLETDDPAVVKRVAALLEPEAGARVALVKGRVTAIEDAGMGDRVCVDTTSMLAPDEGLLVGSASAFLVLVASEASEAGYVTARPFRVNAGAVHAYVQAEAERTHYLSEVGAGTRLVTVRPDGTTRNVTTGRAKVERRPMLLVRIEAEGRSGSVVVQNAETIRLVTPDGLRSVAGLAVGDEVLVHLGHRGGRHFGTAIEESIREA